VHLWHLDTFSIFTPLVCGPWPLFLLRTRRDQQEGVQIAVREYTLGSNFPAFINSQAYYFVWARCRHAVPAIGRIQPKRVMFCRPALGHSPLTQASRDLLLESLPRKLY
jgi:hypothetical protein